MTKNHHFSVAFPIRLAMPGVSITLSQGETFAFY
jgi:hypothetical protein